MSTVSSSRLCGFASGEVMFLRWNAVFLYPNIALVSNVHCGSQRDTSD